jgi:16S rRNA (guanine(966)-N(2))-methyltransferase RsmD
MNITAGIYKGRKIIAPDEKITRPTLSKTRMGIFNTLYSILGDFSGKTFLDVFGGSGIIGLEALSRGFEKVKVYELNKKSAEIIKRNYSSLGLQANLTIGDSLKLLKNSEEIFDVVYIDPPYKSEVYDDILSVVKGNIIIVEHASEINFDNFQMLKQKKYGGSMITYLSKTQSGTIM